MTTYEAIMTLIEEEVRCDIHGDLYGHERVAEHLADYIDGYVKRIKQLEAAQGRLKEALRVNIIRYADAYVSHEDIDALIDAALVGDK